MENKKADSYGDQVTEDSLESTDENAESTEEHGLTNMVIKRLEPQHHLLVLNTNNLCSVEFCQLPRHIITFDERYLIRCLGLIRDHGVFLSKMETFSRELNSQRNSVVSMCNMIGLGAENNTLNSTGDGILGAITGSKSMANILNSPLLVKKKSADIKEPSYSDSAGDSYTISSPNLQSSSCITMGISQAMLRITWDNSLPHYVFSTDGKREVYIADLIKIASTDDKFLDYVYIFQSRLGSFSDLEPNIVGRMTVSSSFTLSSSKSQILETQFILYGCGNDVKPASHHTPSKNKRLARIKKPRSFHEENPWMETKKNLDLGAETLFLPNFELAAIVVRDHTYNGHTKSESGGWGLKFLRKSIAGFKKTSSSSSNECSTSMDVLVPAGFHGGPRTRNGGPSSLLERWASGGHCDCGGWDVGCPLTVLNTRTKTFLEPNLSQDIQNVDLFIQGSKQSVPKMKMANIHDGLYNIHFQSTLLPLQCFAIATAIIHSRSPILRSKSYRK